VQVHWDPGSAAVAVGDVPPGSTHDLTAARATRSLGALPAAASLLGQAPLADKGYGGGIGIHTPAKGAHLAAGAACRNRLPAGLCAEAERGIAVLKIRWKALNRIRLCPRRIGAIAAAALVLTTSQRPIR
jgi:hypothetical protein